MFSENKVIMSTESSDGATHDANLLEQPFNRIPEGTQDFWSPQTAQQVPDDSAMEMLQCYKTLRSSNGRKGSDRKRGSAWTEKEHKKFLIGLQQYGRGDWRSISRNLVVTRTPTQVASHAQKFYLRQQSGKQGRKRSSIHDITTVDSNEMALLLSENDWNSPPNVSMHQTQELSLHQMPQSQILPAIPMKVMQVQNPMHHQPQNPMHHQPQNPMHHQPQNPMHHQPQNPMHHHTQNPMHHQTQNPMHHQTQNPMHQLTQNPMHQLTQNPMHQLTQNHMHQLTQNHMHQLTQNHMHQLPQNHMHQLPQNRVTSVPQNRVTSVPQNLVNHVPPNLVNHVPQNLNPVPNSSDYFMQHAPEELDALLSGLGSQ